MLLIHRTCLCECTKSQILSCPQLDLQKPLSDQGPFSVIFHKLTDVVTQAAKGDNKARCMIDNLEVSIDLSAVWTVFC